MIGAGNEVCRARDNQRVVRITPHDRGDVKSNNSVRAYDEEEEEEKRKERAKENWNPERERQ